MASIEDKIKALFTAKILSVRANEALTRVFVGNEDVDTVITSMSTRKAPAAEKAAAQPRQPKAQNSQIHTGEPSKTNLFVANLPFTVDDAGLLEIFDGHKVKEARIAVRRDKRSRGYGFVTFNNEEEMQQALKAVDKKMVGGRQISVRIVMGEMSDRKVSTGPLERKNADGESAPRERRSRTEAPVGEPSKTVAFVGNLPFSVDDAALKKLFEGYAVKEASVSVRPNGHSKGYALVTFENEADQAKAIAALNNTNIEGRPIHVIQSTRGTRPAAGVGAAAAASGPRPARPPRRPRGEPSKTVLFVSNLPVVVDNDGLLQIFEGFEVKAVQVATRENNRSGHGFVSFGSEAEAERALSVVDKSIVEGTEITVRKARSPPQFTSSVPAASEAK